jgi:hypothetical protein
VCNKFVLFLIYNFRRVPNVVFFFLAIPLRLKFVCRRFGTSCLFHLHRRFNLSRRGITQKKEHNKFLLNTAGNTQCSSADDVLHNIKH